MIVTVVIQPIEKNIREQSISTVYHINGKRRMLLEDDSYVDLDSMPNKDKPFPHTRILPTSVRGSAFITYKYEADPKLQMPPDKKKEAAVKVFWGQHPSAIVGGKSTPFTKSPMFDIINTTDKSVDAAKVWNDKLDICNTVREMSTQERIDALYYFGGNPSKKSESDILMTLVNFENGIVLSDVERDNFKRIYINKESSDQELIVSVRKAMAKGIIEVRTQEGRNSYYLGETFLGTAFNDIIAFCKREEKIYNDFILRQVKDSEPVAVKEVKEEMKTNISANSEISDDEKKETEELREEARQLRKEKFLWQGLSIDIAPLEALRIHVEKARDKKHKAQISVA